MTTKGQDSPVVKRLTVGMLEVNCYVLADPRTKEACVIDPGADPDRIKKFIRDEGLDPKFIINTHGHGDHIAANASFRLPVYIHKLDADFLANPEKNLSSIFIFRVKSPPASRLLEEGDAIELGALRLKVVHTPGHTPGSISLLLNGAVFTGDALFCGSVGRTDFPYGDGELLLESIRKKLLVLPDDTVVYPGHGPSSTIGAERKSNPFLN